MMMEKQLCAPVGASSPYVTAIPSPYPLATPSPFALSIVSTRVSTKPPSLHLANLILRGFALLFSLAAVLTLALAASPTDGNKGSPCSTFSHSSAYWYTVAVAILCLVYTTLPLVKAIMDIALRGLIPEKFLEYAAFVTDQLMAYLLMSSSSILAFQTTESVTAHCRNTINASVVMLCFCFLAVANSALLSGYTLCKRLIW